ncbi:uncharacterized protein LOC143037942 [Oratosquilla oratoria]|uniref:uncharacterized protein LOC143037942 n=1 Tax=Oratosquilla oratoria TaxID=337810 RepID=UPI003F769F93
MAPGHYCEGCSKRNHRKNQELPESTSQELGETSCGYWCDSCLATRGFEDKPSEEFNYGLSLQRLKDAVLDGNSSLLQEVAKKEQLLLHITPSISTPTNITKFKDDLEPDTNTIAILAKCGGGVKNRTSVCVAGDGNCLFYSVSVALCGNEELATNLRVRTVIEMVLNAEFYKEKNNDPIWNDLCPTYEDACRDCALSKDSSLWTVHALATVVGTPIVAVYPAVNGMQDSAIAALSKTFLPRKSPQRRAPNKRIFVMWSKYGSDGLTRAWWTAGHCVPLLENGTDKTKRQNGKEQQSGSCKRPCIRMSSPTATQKQYDMGSPPLHESPILGGATFNEEDKSTSSEPSMDTQVIELPDTQLHDSSTTNDSVEGTSERSDMEKLDRKFLDFQTLILILRTTTTPDHNSIPQGIKQNVYTTVNNQDNVERRKHGRQSVFVDDCGVWDTKSSSTKLTHFVDIGNNCVEVVNKGSGIWCKGKKPLKPQPDEENVWTLCRFNAILKRDRGYRKRVSWIEGGSTIAVVEYIGTFPTTLSFHGNSKYLKGEYVRKDRAVKDAIVQAIKTGKAPQDIYRSMVLDNPGMAPRGKKQVENVKYALNKQVRKKADEILSLLSDINGHEHELIKEVVHTPGHPPSVILYTLEQLQDLVTDEKTVFGVNRTFNLGLCFVTLIVYKNKLFGKLSQDNLLMLGPIYLHWNATFFTYSRFFTHISAKLVEFGVDNLDSIELGIDDVLIGSDEEIALTKAIKHSFSNVTLLLRTRQLEENAKRRLDAEFMERSKKTRAVNEIFGINGLVTMSDSDEFDERSLRMCQKFDKDLPQFAKYFSDKLVPALRSHLLQPQLNHNLPFKWTNNNSESMNHILKLQTNWNTQKFTDLIDRIYDIVQLQYKGMKRGLYGKGKLARKPGQTKRPRKAKKRMIR